MYLLELQNFLEFSYFGRSLLKKIRGRKLHQYCSAVQTTLYKKSKFDCLSGLLVHTYRRCDCNCKLSRRDMFCPLGQSCLFVWFWYASCCICSLLIPNGIWAIRPLHPCVCRFSCIAEMTVSIAKWKKQKRVKMMTQINFFLSPFPFCYKLKKELLWMSGKSAPSLSRSNELSFKYCINASGFMFCKFWGNCQVL